MIPQHANQPLTRQDLAEFALGEARYLQYLHLVEVMENRLKFGLLGGAISLSDLMQHPGVTIRVQSVPLLIDGDGLIDGIANVLYHRFIDCGLAVVKTELEDPHTLIITIRRP